MAMLYTHSIGNPPQNPMVVFKMRDSGPINARYSPICNVLRQWRTSLIPTYRVYRLYDSFLPSPLCNINIYYNCLLFSDAVKNFAFYGTVFYMPNFLGLCYSIDFGAGCYGSVPLLCF